MLWRQVECWPWKVEVHSIFLQSCCRRQTMNPDLREVAWNLTLLCAKSKTTRFDENCSDVPISKRRNSTKLLLALVAVLGLAERNWRGWNDVIRPTSFWGVVGWRRVILVWNVDLRRSIFKMPKEVSGSGTNKSGNNYTGYTDGGYSYTNYNSSM